MISLCILPNFKADRKGETFKAAVLTVLLDACYIIPLIFC
jgi:hypothetical protein